MKKASLERARAAKKKALHLLSNIPEVNGVGIIKKKGKYTIKVNLSQEIAEPDRIPTEINSVPVIVNLIGTIHKQRD
ncbi:MAG TPA: hypothetical protein ENI23_00560 [bacterium]|nr:hypothetical protein [bacterium]